MTIQNKCPRCDKWYTLDSACCQCIEEINAALLAALAEITGWCAYSQYRTNNARDEIIKINSIASAAIASVKG
uniref:Uncharacterized protein n=1 Tax=viral metagenome TaxID=1070528 RepID=A0A6H1Z9L5_9ZZZZ